MKYLLSFSLIFLFIGCSNGISNKDLQNLNGYWEIDNVVFPDGKIKEFKASTTIDYIELENFNGFRKKVQPKFDGTYSTSNDSELLSIIEIKERFYMSYSNNLSEWREQVLSIDTDAFSTVSDDGLQYNYKRFQPINAKE